MNCSREICMLQKERSSGWWEHHLAMGNLLRLLHSRSTSGPGHSNAPALELVLIEGTWMLPPESSPAGALPVDAESPAYSAAA